MANIDCAASLQLCALRVARLEPDGVPDPGAGNVYTTDALILLTPTAVYTEGDDLEQKNGCGSVCISFKDCDRFKRVDAELQLCAPDPELHELLLGGDLITSGANTIGFAMPEVGGTTCPNGVSIEAWTKAWDGDAQATDMPYWRFVMPRTYWKLGARNLENAFMTNPLTGFGVQNPNFFDGPANDVPDTDISHRALYWFRDDSLPTVDCGANTLVAS